MSRDATLPFPAAAPAARRPPTLLFGTAVGLIVMNIFAPQTLIAPIAADLGLGAGAAGLVATATLLGYALGLFLLVPLADIVENRRLTLGMLACAALCAGLAAVAPGAPVFLALLVVLGAACSAIQILVPLVAAMTPAETRGKVIGDVMGGLMVGILLARPLASLGAGALGWRGFYLASAAVLVITATVLALRLEPHRPAAQARYLALVASLGTLLRTESVLRQRALTASLAGTAFALFWTVVAPRLAAPPFGLGPVGIAIFALAGAGGALATPLAGRAGDRGWTRPVSLAAHAVLIAGLLLAAWADRAGPELRLAALVAMALAGFAIDAGVTADQTLGRRAINLIRPEARGRLNGLFVGLFFLGGALGAALAGPIAAAAGWSGVCAAGIALSLGAALVHLRDARG